MSVLRRFDERLVCCSGVKRLLKSCFWKLVCRRQATTDSAAERAVCLLIEGRGEERGFEGKHSTPSLRFETQMSPRSTFILCVSKLSSQDRRRESRGRLCAALRNQQQSRLRSSLLLLSLSTYGDRCCLCHYLLPWRLKQESRAATPQLERRAGSCGHRASGARIAQFLPTNCLIVDRPNESGVTRSDCLAS